MRGSRDGVSRMWQAGKPRGSDPECRRGEAGREATSRDQGGNNCSG
jgi:hypothetical protein